MTQIVPQHSRPIDVHRWSDHPEVRALVRNLWDAHFTDYSKDETSRSGPKRKRRYQDQLRVLILDLYVAWCADPDLSIGVHLSNTQWKANSRYNALHLSKVIIKFIERLEELGFIDVAKGSYSGPGAPSNRNARIRAAEPLRKLFRDAKFGLLDIGATPDRECIILRAEDHDNSASKPIEYEDNQQTTRMRDDLRAYNTLLSGTFIDIPSLNEPYLERKITKGRAAGQVIRVPIGPTNMFVRRVFSRGRWDLNGRFYGGWWQQISKEWRNKIYINNTPTVEVDFKGLHLAILSAEKGVPLQDDPYELPAGLIDGCDGKEQRALLKRLILTAINARDRKSAFKSFRDDFAAGERGKKMKDVELDHLLSAFTEKYPHLADSICSDQGIRLMNVDSRIAGLVLRASTKRAIPVLCIHDSFIVDYARAKQLKVAMKAAAVGVVGQVLGLSNNYLGLDEMADAPEVVKQDFIDFRTQPPTPGYLERQRWFEEGKNRK